MQTHFFSTMAQAQKAWKRWRKVNRQRLIDGYVDIGPIFLFGRTQYGFETWNN